MAPEALDGDGWTKCDAGHDHWGRHGAAGLLLRAVDGSGRPVILLQRRADWTHHGGTWGIPGGAKSSRESPQDAALREVGEEVEITLGDLVVDHVHHDDHGGWSYWTVVADTASPLLAVPRGKETAEMRWVPIDEVTALPLHPGFAATWPLIG